MDRIHIGDGVRVLLTEKGRQRLDDYNDARALALRDECTPDEIAACAQRIDAQGGWSGQLKQLLIIFGPAISEEQDLFVDGYVQFGLIL